MCSDGSHVQAIWNSVLVMTTSRFFCRCVDLWASGMGTSSEFAVLVGGGKRLSVRSCGRVGVPGFVACG
jgi:hypothetical protein